MKKKVYIKPALHSVRMLSNYYLAVGSPETPEYVHETDFLGSRESSIWDDEEEEETTGGWFQ